MPAHSNALAAAFFFIAAIISDALTAIDSTEHADVPASLRGTSLVLVCTFAAPVLVRPEKGIYGWLQRPLVGAALLAVALLGVHHGGVGTRTFDALYITTVCFLITYLFSAGGVDEAARASEKGAKIEKAVSMSSAMLSGSLLLYSSMRILRAGLRHPTEVVSFRVSPSGKYNASSAIQTLGYAYASDMATVAVTFGGAIGIGAAVVMTYHVRELANGTGTVALQLGVAACYTVLAALASSLSQADQINWLPAIFGETACTSNSDACEVAATSRRFASVNTQASGLWLTAIGLFCLAYPINNRLKDRKQASTFVWNFAGSVFGGIAAAAALGLVYMYSDFSGRGGHTDYLLLGSVFAIYWSVFFDTYVGTLIYVVGFTIDETLYANEYGIATLFSNPTHVALILCAGVLSLHIILQTVAFVWAPRQLQVLIGILTAAGSSLAVALYLASAALLMSNNGSISNLRHNNDGTRFSISFIYQHFVPLFVWAPLYSCRCELQLLTRTQRLATWLSMMPLVILVYAISLFIIGGAPPIAEILDTEAIWGCVVGVGLVPWLAASSV